MAVWFADYSGGSVNSSGDSFAVTLALTDLVATGTTTVTSVTGGFTGLAGRKIFIVGIGGRTISSVMNNNTVVLNASVAIGTYSANVGGRRTTMDSFTTANCQGYAAGDTIRCKESPTPTSLSASGNWGDCSPTIILMGGAGTVIADCETAFTASANVTATADATVFKVGSKSAKLVVAAGFTTGLAAYFPTGTLDLSANQILSFWFRQESGTNIIAGDLTIRLCSDAAGTTTVNNLSVPLLPIGGSAAGAKDVWVPMAIDLGSAMGASIQSIAIYIAVDRGASTYYFDDFKVWTAPNINKNVDMCDSAWTASANVTVSNGGARKEGTQSQKIAVAAGFTTGLAAYKALSGATDYSGYKQISFSLRQTAGTLLAASGMSIRLCSDAVGAVSVDQLNIPALTGSATNQWHQITIDKGSALGASIQSVALYVDTDAGAQDIEIDGIIACKDSTSADALSLRSLIGRPNSTGAGGSNVDTWYAIRSINGNTVTLETGPNSTAATASRGYYGGSVNPPAIETTWKRETIKTAFVASAGTAVQSAQISGSAGNLVTWSGGWATADMATQTGETWFDGGNGFGVGLNLSSKTYNKCTAFGVVRYDIGSNFGSSATNSEVTYCHGNCNSSSGLRYNSTSTWSNLWACNNGGTSGISQSTSSYTNFVVSNVFACNNIGAGIISDGYNSTFSNINASNTSGAGYSSNSNGSNEVVNGITANRCSTNGASPGNADTTIISATVQGCGTSGVALGGNATGFKLMNSTIANSGTSGVSGGAKGLMFLFNTTLSDSSEVTGLAGYANSAVLSTRHDNTDNNHYGFLDGGTFNSQTSVRHTASGIAWQMNPTSTNRSATYPLKMSLGHYTVPSGSTTIKVWLRRTDTGLTMSLVCPGGRLPGVASDVTASMTAAANTWEEVSIAITPTSAGVVELEVWAYGGTTYTGYVDDLTIGSVAVPLDQGWQGQPHEDAIVSAAAGSASFSSFPNGQLLGL